MNQTTSHHFKPSLMGHFNTLSKNLQQSLQIVSQFQTVLNKKFAIDEAYADKIDSLSSHLQHSFLADFIGSLLLTNNALRNSIATFSANRPPIQSQARKMLALGREIEKGVLLERDKLEKIKSKFQKKNEELKIKKISYIGGVLAGESLQVRNKLYLKIVALQKDISPLRKEYQYYADKYNQNVENNAEIMKNIIQVLSEEECKRNKAIQTTLKLYYEQQLTIASQMLCNLPLCSLPQDVSYDQDSFLQSKEQLFIPFSVSSAYIDAMFAKIQNKSIDEVILHCIPQHKSAITTYFQTGQGAVSLPQKSYALINLFKKYFQSDQLSSEGELRNILRNQPFLRKQFLVCLQQYRINKIFQLRKSNYQSIIRALTVYLDECMRNNDTYNAKHLMVLSVTYYFLRENQKIDLMEVIKVHRIWADIGWWEAALLQSIYEEVKIKHVKKTQFVLDEWHLKGQNTHLPHFNGQQGTYHHVAFNQLAYYIHNMVLFNINPHMIKQFALKYIQVLGFSTQMSETIKLMCPNQESTNYSLHATHQ